LRLHLDLKRQPSTHPQVPTGDMMIGGGDGSLSILKTAPEGTPGNLKLLKKMARVAEVGRLLVVVSLFVFVCL
jgi:hypothetical protein